MFALIYFHSAYIYMFTYILLFDCLQLLSWLRQQYHFDESERERKRRKKEVPLVLVFNCGKWKYYTTQLLQRIFQFVYFYRNNMTFMVFDNKQALSKQKNISN